MQLPSVVYSISIWRPILIRLCDCTTTILYKRLDSIVSSLCMYTKTFFIALVILYSSIELKFIELKMALVLDARRRLDRDNDVSTEVRSSSM